MNMGKSRNLNIMIDIKKETEKYFLKLDKLIITEKLDDRVPSTGSHLVPELNQPVSTVTQPSSEPKPEDPEDPNDNPPKNPAGSAALEVPIITVDTYSKRKVA